MELKDLKLSNNDIEYINMARKYAKKYKRNEEESLLLSAQSGNETVRNDLISSKLHIVVNVALKFTMLHMPFDELVQEGNITLIKCIDQFVQDESTELDYFISMCVNRTMTKMFLVKNYGNATEKNRLLVFNVYKFIYEYFNNNGYEPSDLIIADTLGLDIVKVKEIRTHKEKLNSLDLNDSCDEEQDLFEQVDDWDIINIFSSCLDAVTPKQRIVIEYRLGLFDGKPYSNVELSKIFGVTSQDISKKYRIGIERIKTKIKIRYPDFYNECSKERK